MNKKLLLLLIPIILIIGVIMFFVFQKKVLPESSFEFADGGTYDYISYDEIDAYYEAYQQDMIASDEEFWTRNAAYNQSILHIIEYIKACKFDVAPQRNDKDFLTFVLSPSKKTQDFVGLYNMYIREIYIKDYNQLKNKNYDIQTLDITAIKEQGEEVCEFLHFLEIHYPSVDFYLKN